MANLKSTLCQNNPFYSLKDDSSKPMQCKARTILN